MTANKYILTAFTAVILFMICPSGSPAQTARPSIPVKPEVGYENRAPYRTEFVSFSTREAAVNDDRESEFYYRAIESMSIERDSCSVKYNSLISLPGIWCERETFLHTAGGRNSHSIYVNDKFAGSARDSGVPSEFNISGMLRPGVNMITVEIHKDTTEPESALRHNRPDLETVFLYSQPRVRLEDYSISALKSGGDGRISVEIMLRNSNSYRETVTVGYDVYSPAGRLEHYDLRDITLEGNSRDTLRLSEIIEAAGNNLWNASSPKLYEVMFFIRKNGIMTEYVFAAAGFGSTKYEKGQILRNGKAIAVKSSPYTAANPGQTIKDIRAYKKKGINTLCPDYPQPYWFYDICDREGMYVIEQININSDHDIRNMRIGGTLSNNPEWLSEYMERTKAAYYRSRNHPCIIGWSLGGDSGNGYNMQKTYLWMKDADKSRPVIYSGASGEWNTDIILITGTALQRNQQ